MHHKEGPEKVTENPEAGELRTAGQRAEHLVREAERYAETQRESAEQQCSELLKESTQTLNAAKQRAQTLVEEAERYAEELRKSAARPTAAAGGSNKSGEWMMVAPDEVVGRSFSVVRRGYDQAEVDEFLRAVAADYETAVAKIEHAAGEALDPERIGKEIKDILLAAHNAAERVKTNAREEAEKLVRAAKTNKQRTGKEIERITRAADGKLVAAKTEAERIESEAKQKASRETSKEIEQAKKYARELRESAERRANDLAAEMKRREDEQQQLVQEMLSRIGNVDGLMQKLRAHFEMPDVIDVRDPETSDEREPARDLERP